MPPLVGSNGDMTERCAYTARRRHDFLSSYAEEAMGTDASRCFSHVALILDHGATHAL